MNKKEHGTYQYKTIMSCSKCGYNMYHITNFWWKCPNCGHTKPDNKYNQPYKNE